MHKTRTDAPSRGLSAAKPRISPKSIGYFGTMLRPLVAGAPQGSAWQAVLALFVMLAVTLPSPADEPTLDELLDLDDRPPADTSPEDEEPADDDAQPDEPDEPDEAEMPPGLDTDEDIRRLLRGQEAADAFEQAVRQMDDVARRLGGELDPGLATQREQESILAKLEQVIEAAQQQQMSSQSQGGQGQGQQQQPRDQDAGAQDLAQQGSEGQSGDAEAQSTDAGAGENTGQSSAGNVIDAEQGEGPLEELRREWGQLPPRLRDEISEGLQERFSPAYRSMTEAYYRRLAEEEN